MLPVSIRVEVQRNTDGDTPSRTVHTGWMQDIRMDRLGIVIAQTRDIALILS